MNKETTEEKKCLFIINSGVNFKAVHEHVKSIQGFYNGAGWYVEYREAFFHNYNFNSPSFLEELAFRLMPMSETAWLPYLKRLN